MSAKVFGMMKESNAAYATIIGRDESGNVLNAAVYVRGGDEAALLVRVVQRHQEAVEKMSDEEFKHAAAAARVELAQAEDGP